MKNLAILLAACACAINVLAGNAPGVTWSADEHTIRFRVKPEGKPADAPV